MYNLLKKMGEELNKQRTIDLSIEKTLKSMKTGYKVVPSMEIKAWKAYLVVTFIAGFSAALIWGSYMSIYPVTRANGTAQVTLSTSSSVAAHKAGDEFPIDILLNTAGKNIVAVQAIFNYDKSALQFMGADISDSAFTYEVKNSVDANQGQGYLDLAKPAPGVNGASVKVGKLNFKALSDIGEPSVTLKFDSAAAVTDSASILDDGQGTNVLEKLAYLFPSPSPPVNPAPVNFNIVSIVSLADTIVRLDWSNGSVADGGYSIERRAKKTSYVSIASVAADQRMYVDRKAVRSTSYLYRICQQNGTEKTCTAEKQIKTQKKKKIFKPRITVVYQNAMMNIFWNPNFTSDFRVYVQKKTGKQKKFTTIGSISSDSENSYQDTSIIPGTKYTYRLAIAARGKSTQYSKDFKIIAP